MADPQSGTQQTGDLLRPVRSRPTGTKAIAWYAVIGLLATVAIVYLVGIFAAPPREATAGASPLGQPAAQAGSNPDDAFRYSGKVVDDRRAATTRAEPHSGHSAGPDAVPTPAGAASPLATPTPPPPLITVPHDTAATAVLGATTKDVPDVSEAAASRVRVPLPTPAPDDGAGARAPLGIVPDRLAHRRGIVVLYGAPTTAATPVPAGEPASVTSGAATMGVLGTPASALPVASPRLPSAPEPSTAGAAGLRGETMPGFRRPPLARYLIAAGTAIPVQLDVALESDVAGPVVAHVLRDVVDELTGKTLIPGGTRALGDYTGLTTGQSRLSMVWRRLVFPDRSSFPLDGLPALDQHGRVGVGGTLSTHEGALVRRSLLGGVLAEIASRMRGQPSGNTVVVINPGTGSPAGLPQAALDLASGLNQRDAHIPPGLTIPQNAIFSLYVDRDMLFDAPYAPMTPGGPA